MKSEIIKEVKYAIRSGKIIILFSSFLFFAILTPIMLKVILPMILSNQMGTDNPQDIETIINMNQIGCIQNYISDVIEIIIIIIAFSLCGLTAAEIKNNTLVLPLCSGKKFINIILGKFIVFGLSLFIISISVLMINYFYSGHLFGYQISIDIVLKGGLLQGLYMLFFLSSLLMYGVISKNPITTGFLSLATALGVHLLSSLFKTQKWTPSGLIIEAQKLTPIDISNIYISIIVTVFLIVIFLKIALYKYKKIEWNNRNAST